MNASVGQDIRKASAALAEGRYREAHAICLSVLKTDPRAAEALYLLGVIAADHQNHSKACSLFDRALALAPSTSAGRARYQAERARSLVALFRREDALEAAEAAAKGPQLSARTQDTIGVVFSRLGLHARAVEHYRRATALDPDNPSFLYNLASGLQFAGDLGLAERTYRRVLEIDPGHVKAWSSLVLMAKQTRDFNAIAKLEALFASLSDPDDRLHIGHALAKTHEDLGDPDAAMTWLEAAKFAKRAVVQHHEDDIRRLFAAAASTATSPAGSSATGWQDASPIFIVGLPRTGTTLVDRILSQHSSVRSAGELSDFALELKLRTGTPSAYVLDPETLLAAQAIDLAAAGAAYIARARRVVGDAPRFVDKMPLNFFYVPLILRALPQARVICLRRHPADSVLSNYRQMFATGFSYYSYGYDLRWTARYYAAFDRLMATWRSTLPTDRFTEVAYESIVEDLEAQARRLVAFCDLDWEPQCVDFHKNAAPVATASSAQVRQPLYSTSVGRWRRYLPHMQPALDVLAQEGVQLP